ncbi:MAG: hypothetical protein EBR48_03510 [bacterium]|nr:hypothetical protein [Candidatus Aquidulcis frankliniae]
MVVPGLEWSTSRAQRRHARFGSGSLNRSLRRSRRTPLPPPTVSPSGRRKVATRRAPAAPKDAAARAHTAGRRDALTALYESDFGIRTALAVLERRVASGDVTEETLIWSRPLLEVVEANRPQIDAAIERFAPTFPLATMARIDRSLLRCGLGEVIHSRTAAPTEAIAAWTALARTYSGEPARKLVNGVLGTAHREVAATAERDGGSNS